MPVLGIARNAGTALARAFVVSIAMAALMILMAFGFMYLFSPGASLPVSTAVVLVVFALCFVASAVLLERAGAGGTPSLVGGAAIALGLTIFLMTAGCGVYYVTSGKLSLDQETLLIGFAAALVASVVINQLTLKV